MDSEKIPLMVDIATDPLRMFVRLWVCFNPRSTKPKEVFVEERMQAVFRAFVNDSLPPKRQPVPFHGYGQNPALPGPQTFSVELQNLTVTKNLTKEQRDLIPAQLSGWKGGKLTYMMSWVASSCVRIEQRPRKLSDEQKEECELFDKFLKEGLGGKFYVMVASGDHIANKMNQLASAPMPLPPSYWPWMNGTFRIGDDGLESPLAFDPREFDQSRRESSAWIRDAFVERDPKEVHAQGVNATEASPAKFSRMYPLIRFIDSRQYFAHQAISALYEAREEQDNKEVWANGDHRCFVVPDKNTGNRYAIFLNIRKPDATDDGLAENSGAGLPEVGERVRVAIRMDSNEETWWGFVARIPNEYAHLGCNVAVIATRPPVRGGEIKPRSMVARFIFGYPNLTLDPMLNRLGLLCFGDPNDWFLQLLLCQKPPDIERGDHDLTENWREVVEKVASKRNLNPEQLQAVKSFYANRVSLLIGPPGTGKSTVIDTILELNCLFMKKFWVMAESNKAVDVLVDKFCNTRGKDQEPFFYRVKKLFQETLLQDQERGGWTSSGLDKTGNDALDAVQAFFDETKDSQHKLALGADMAGRIEELGNDGFRERWKGEVEALKDVRRTKAVLTKIRMQRPSGDPVVWEKKWREFEADARAEFTQVLFDVQRRTLSEAHGVFSTTAAASTKLIKDFCATSIVIDEASQAGECGLASCLAGLLGRTKVKRILLVGDDHQLPPVVLAKMNPLGDQGQLSLFERLLKAGFRSTTLVTQYRMHPDISRIANQAVYGGVLRRRPRYP